MPFVERNTDGRITAIVSDGTEMLAPNHPDVLAFLFSGSLGESGAALLSADMTLIRVIEDIVETLVSKGILHAGELPAAARDKLKARGGLRHDHLQSLDLIGSGGLPPI